LRLSVFGFLWLLLVADPFLFAQQTPVPAPQTTIKVRVNQVLVPVIVTDKRGHYVSGLRARDFEVTEDGVEQKIVDFLTSENGAERLFQPITLTSSPPAGTSNPNKALRRTYLICLDTMNTSFTDFADVRNALLKLFRSSSVDDAAYGLLSIGRQTMIVQNLTKSPADMLAMLDSKVFLKTIQNSESSNLARQEFDLTAMLNDYCEKCPCAGEGAITSRTSGGSGQVCTGKWGSIELWAGSAAQERTMLVRDFIRQLRAVVQQLALLPGKRTLILVSDGFNLRPGSDLFAMMAAYARNPTEKLQNPGDDLHPELAEVIRSATSSNVSIYTLDSRGLSTASTGYNADGDYQMTRLTVILPEIQQERETTALDNQDSLAQLAGETGGVFYHNSNDLLKGMRQSFEDGRAYYVLTYVPSNSANDGKFRKIAVQVKGKDIVVRSKHGYWAPQG
jgi:VWFA-related protein